jgi:hypothetical protein
MTSQILSEIDAPCRNSTQEIFNIANLAVIFAEQVLNMSKQTDFTIKVESKERITEK